MLQPTSIIQAFRGLANRWLPGLIITAALAFNAADAIADSKAVPACADCAWFIKLLPSGADEDIAAARTKILLGISEANLKRAVGAIAIWLKDPTSPQYGLATQSLRTLIEGHKRWSCQQTSRLEKTWPSPTSEPDLLAAELAQLEVLAVAKCKKTFSGSVYMSRALKPEYSLSIRVAIVDGLIEAGYHPQLPELTSLLKADQPELRLAAVNWMKREQSSHGQEVASFLREAAADKTKQIQTRAYQVLASLPATMKAKYWEDVSKPQNFCNRLSEAEVREACFASLETP